jgi:hypothetical protein
MRLILIILRDKLRLFRNNIEIFIAYYV